MGVPVNGGQERHVGRVALVKGEIVVRGGLTTGLRGRVAGETRGITAIAQIRQLLERLRAEEPLAAPSPPVLKVGECERA